MNTGGRDEDVASIQQAVENAAEKGIPSVVAAGNAGPYYYSIESPGNVEQVITVGAISGDERIWAYSSRGPTPYRKLVKPEVVSIGVNVQCPVPDQEGNVTVETRSGTSVAATSVTGVAGLIKSAHPDWTGSRIKNALVCTARPLTHNGRYYDVFTQGAGLVNAQNAIETDIVICDAVLSLGALYTNARRSSTLSVENISEDKRTLEITARLRRVNAEQLNSDHITASPSTVVVPAQDSVKVEVTVDPPEQIGIYSGRLFFDSPNNGRIASAILGYTKFDETYHQSKPDIKAVTPDIQH